MAQVVIENLYKSFAAANKNEVKSPDLVKTTSKSFSNHVLKGINLTVAEGEFMVLVGPSGCGKSTMLRLLAGLEEVSAGKIWLGDNLINNLPPKARNMAMVFQNYALYPHLNVYDNIAFGLRRMNQTATKLNNPQWTKQLATVLTHYLPSPLKYISNQEKCIQKQVLQVAKLLQIETLLTRLPKQLSGGQKQRVALGRAIARNPQVFLMDEPLSNLDAKLRAETRIQIVKLQKQLAVTTIYVTHDQTEAMTMGDRIAVMNQGEIQQIATPLEIYNQPKNKFVAEFIGSPPMNFIPVKLQKPLLINHPLFQFNLPPKWQNKLDYYDQKTVLLGIRPEHFHIDSEGTNQLPVTVDLVEALGNQTYLSVHLKNDLNTKLQIIIAPDYQVKIDDYLWLSVNLEKVHIFDSKTGKNLL